MRPDVIRPSARVRRTSTAPAPVSSVTASASDAEPSTYAVPSVGCPANGSSLNGVKIRIR